jgi:sporulation protein YlmC with PRC-barrel domain
MKRTITLLSIFAALGMGQLARAAEAEVKAHVDTPDVKVRTDVDKDRTDRAANETVIDARAARREAPKKVNKASGIMGMEVRNKDNEKLGEIKDLALDLNSGKVSYAVLAVGGFLGLGEKLLAIPTSAFEAAPDYSYLILDADKAKIQGAPGFAATNWPRLDDQEAVSNRYWSTRAAGAPATTETRSATERRLRSDADLRTERREKLYTDAKDKDHAASAKASVDVDTDHKSATLKAGSDLDNKDYRVLHGKVSSVDAKNNRIVVQTDTGEKRVFTLDDQATLRLGKEKNVHLDDFKSGYNVDIRYDNKNGHMTAYSIDRTTP